MKESVEFEASSEVFTETLISLIENKSVIVNKFRNRECISHYIYYHIYHINSSKKEMQITNWKQI